MTEVVIKLDWDAVTSALIAAGSHGSVTLTVSVDIGATTAGTQTTAPIRPRGPLAPLLQAGLLRDGDRLRFDQPRAGRTAYASVRGDGRLIVDGKAGTFTSPSKAATAVTGSQINGWTLWHRESDGRTLDQLREDLDASDHE